MAGNWTLAQAADHCVAWIDFALNGAYPRPPLPMRPIFWFVSRTMGPFILRRMFKNDAMDDGLPTASITVPPSNGGPNADMDAAAADRLTDAVVRLAKYEGPIPRSPLFGPMNVQDARNLHRIHTAHHLKFLIPLS